MKKTIFVALIMILCLSGCSAKPYSNRKVTAYLDERFGGENRFTLQEIVKDNRADNSIQSWTYFYHDNERNIDFTVKTLKYGWFANAIVIFPHKEIYSHLNREIMYGYREQAVTYAEEYGLTLRPVESLLSGEKTFERAEDFIYVKDYSQLEVAAKLFFDLRELYNLEDEGSGGASFVFCEDPSNDAKHYSVERLLSLPFYQPIEKNEAVVIANEEQLSRLLKERWQEIFNK